MAKVHTRGLTPKSLLRVYDRGFVRPSITNIKVDDNRIHSWTTVYDNTVVTDEYSPTIKQIKRDIADAESNVINYREKAPQLKIAIDSLTRKKHELMLKYSKYSDKAKLAEVKSYLTRARTLLNKENKRKKNRDTERVDKLQNIIDINTRYISKEMTLRSQLHNVTRELNRLKREYKHINNYNEKRTKDKLARLNKRLQTAYNDPMLSQTSPYLEGEVSRAQEEYDRLNLTLYYSKEDMYVNFKKINSNFWTTHDINKYWEQYLHRDELIATGQYQEIMATTFRDNYIKALSRISTRDPMINKIVANLKALSTGQLIDLFGARDANVTKSNNYVMPVIGFVYEIAGIHGRPSSLEEY